jgi:hypothetical protein
MGKNLINFVKFWLHIKFKNMNLHWLTCMQTLEIPLDVVNMIWIHNIQKSWPLRDIEPTIINPPVLKIGQGVLYDGLCILLFYIVDMCKLNPKIQEVVEYQRYLIV